MNITPINTAADVFKKQLFKMNNINQCPTCRKGAPLRDLTGLKEDTVEIKK